MMLPRIGCTVCNECGHQVPHCTYDAPSYPSVTTSSGAFCGVNTTFSTSASVLSKMAPEEVVTDGYEGASYVQCGT
jgi:hypothetical protein